MDNWWTESQRHNFKCELGQKNSDNFCHKIAVKIVSQSVIKHTTKEPKIKHNFHTHTHS